MFPNELICFTVNKCETDFSGIKNVHYSKLIQLKTTVNNYLFNSELFKQFRVLMVINTGSVAKCCMFKIISRYFWKEKVF